MPLPLSVKNLTVHYPSSPVLSNITFEAREGEFVAIIGKSGSGKTTFLHALAGFIRAEGEIQRPPLLGMVFQKDAVFPWMTVAKNIEFGIKNHKHNFTQRHALISKYVKLAGLEGKENTYPGQLSGGQIQRVALARALAHDPDALLMDEPYGALDAYTREQMQSWLLDVWATHKKTIIFVTHSIEEALFLADRVLVLEGGHFEKEYVVPFPRPRIDEIKFTQEFSQLKKKLYNTLT